MLHLWKPIKHELDLDEKIVIYNFGEWMGYLYGDEWTCWKVTGRMVLEDGSVVEKGEEVPTEWAPMRGFFTEIYPCKKCDDGFYLPGWKLSNGAIVTKK